MSATVFEKHFIATRWVAQFTRGTPTTFLFRVAVECNFDPEKTDEVIALVASMVQRTLTCDAAWDPLDAALIEFHRASFRRETLPPVRP
jgi:hypothetical protein